MPDPAADRMLKPACICLALAIALTARAQPPTVPSPPAMGVQAGDYLLTSGHTKVVFTVAHFPFGAYAGQFVGASGEMRLDPKDLSASRLDVKVPIDGVKTQSSYFASELKGPGWFDAARFPFMTFRSTAITATGPTTADVAGDLTLHGVTRPVVFKARWNAAGANPLDKSASTGFEVRGVIRRREFGVTRYEPFVSDDVHIVISAAFERAPS
jgi:polyisoprenoid-binding protein YceI